MVGRHLAMGSPFPLVLMLFVLVCRPLAYVEAAEAAADLTSTYRDVTELIDFWGYDVEEHVVLTDDGYILTMHRIPSSVEVAEVDLEAGGFYSGSNGSSSGEEVVAKLLSLPPRVLLLHGIFGTSARWTLGPPDRTALSPLCAFKSMAYLLADRGFDVWLGNTRGNTYSQNHTSLNPDEDKAFWNFTFHEAGIYDLPAMIDYINEITDPDAPFFYVCHSMGCTEALVLLSELPEYNDLIDAAFLLAPPAFMGNSRASRAAWMADLFGLLDEIKELRRKPSHRKWLSRTGCKNFFCRYMAAKMLSVNYDQLNQTMLPVIFDHTSQGSSSKVVFHFAQLTQDENLFRKYDYGEELNQLVYDGASQPPDYNLGNITTPLYLFWGDGDRLINAKDVDILASKLPSLVMNHRVDYEGWNHNDFVYAINATELVYNLIIKEMENIASRPSVPKK